MAGFSPFLIVWFTGIILIWPAWFWFSYQSRKSRGEPIHPRPPVNAIFCEGWASGSNRNNFLGQAHNCLLVAVSADGVWITPRFPFNMIAPHGFMGLEYRVPLSAIRQAEMRGRFPFSRYVLFSFADAGSGREVSLALRLRNPEAFVSALQRQRH